MEDVGTECRTEGQTAAEPAGSIERTVASETGVGTAMIRCRPTARSGRWRSTTPSTPTVPITPTGGPIAIRYRSGRLPVMPATVGVMDERSGYRLPIQRRYVSTSLYLTRELLRASLQGPVSARSGGERSHHLAARPVQRAAGGEISAVDQRQLSGSLGGACSYGTGTDRRRGLTRIHESTPGPRVLWCTRPPERAVTSASEDCFGHGSARS